MVLSAEGRSCQSLVFKLSRNTSSSTTPATTKLRRKGGQRACASPSPCLQVTSFVHSKQIWPVIHPSASTAALFFSSHPTVQDTPNPPSIARPVWHRRSLFVRPSLQHQGTPPARLAQLWLVASGTRNPNSKVLQPLLRPNYPPRHTSRPALLLPSATPPPPPACSNLRSPRRAPALLLLPITHTTLAGSAGLRARPLSTASLLACHTRRHRHAASTVRRHVLRQPGESLTHFRPAKFSAPAKLAPAV